MQIEIEIHGVADATINCPEAGMEDQRWTMIGTAKLGQYRLKRQEDKTGFGKIVLSDRHGRTKCEVGADPGRKTFTINEEDDRASVAVGLAPAGAAS